MSNFQHKILGDHYLHNLKHGDQYILLVIELIDYDLENDLYRVKQSIHREYKITTISGKFLNDYCTKVDRQIDILHHLNKPLSDTELSFCKLNGYSDGLPVSDFEKSKNIINKPSKDFTLHSNDEVTFIIDNKEITANVINVFNDNKVTVKYSTPNGINHYLPIDTSAIITARGKPIGPNKKFIDYIKSQPVTQEQTFDTVFKPKHYNSTKIETIDVIEDMLSSYDKIESLPSSLPYFLGNTIKYIARSPLKGDMLEDLEKASYYLNKAISKLKEDKQCLK